MRLETKKCVKVHVGEVSDKNTRASCNERNSSFRYRAGNPSAISDASDNKTGRFLLA